MRSFSLAARQALTAAATDVVPIVLVTIEHDDLAEPVRLSSDPTERLSIEPLAYGTRHLSKTYAHVLMSARLPDNRERAPPKTQLAFENVDASIVETIRSITTPATVTLTLVLSSAPDVVEARWTDLRVIAASYDANKVTLSVSREPFTSEPWPAGRISKARFPGLFP